MFDKEKQLSKALKQEKKSILGFFIKKYRVTYLILTAITALGLFSIFTLPKESEPEVKIPIAIITTIYRGATTIDVEETITNEIEDEIKNLDNLNKYTSSSSSGISNITVEFKAESDLKESFQKLRDSVDKAKNNLPKEAEEPFITEININDIPIITYSLFGNFNEAKLKKFADDLKKEFENIKNVSKVETLGGFERDFLISVNQNKLTNFNISISQVINSINKTNFDLPSGNIEIDGFNYNIKVKGKFQKSEEINNLVIKTYNETPIYLKDIAFVSDTFKKQYTKSRLGFSNDVPKKTISLQVYKKTGGNILKIIEETKKTIYDLKNNNILPKNLTIKKTNDNSVFIREDLKRLSFSGLQTMILIFILILLFLGWKKSIIASLSIPVAFFITFIVLYIQGATLNSMVLFSLVLSLGLMVDNSIVIMEGINEYINKYKKTPFEASILSVWNYKWPIISGTLTTVAAFVPMLLVSGIMGEYMSILPKTISATLLSSLFVSLIILPAFAHRIIKIKIKNNNQGTFKLDNNSYVKKYLSNAKNYFSNIFIKIQKYYAKKMILILLNKKLKRKIIISSWLIFLTLISFPFIGIIKIEMFPKIDLEYFVVNIKLPIGSVLEKTEEIASKVEKIIAEIPELDNYVTNIGTSTSLGLTGDRTAIGPGSDNSHLASITVNLIDKKERLRKSFEIADSIRPNLIKIQGAVLTVEELSSGPPTGAPIEIRIKGENIKILSYISENIENILKNTKGVINVKNSIQDASGELAIIINNQKANYYGLDISYIASELRSIIYGAKASTVNINRDEIDITVKYDDKSIKNINDLENIYIFNSQNETIPIKEISDISLEPSVLNINHRKGDRTISVTGYLEKGANLQDTLKEFNKNIKNINIENGYRIEIGGEIEDIEKSYREIFYSMIIAIMLIVFILILQFNSFKQSFIIIFTLPLAIIGVIIGLSLMRVSFSLPVFIGIVSLTGIVVNNAIILIDKINKNIKNGMEYKESIINGVLSRIQPIFLTSATTIIGIFPLYFADELWQGLSLTIMFGLLFSTVLTLFIVPIMYYNVSK